MTGLAPDALALGWFAALLVITGTVAGLLAGLLGVGGGIIIVPALGSGIGVFSAMMGIGGGTLSVPVLTLFSYPMHRAVGTASALGLVIAVPGALGFMVTGLGVADRPAMSVGYVNLLAVATLVPMTVAMAPLGAALAHRLDGGKLRQIFALFLLVTAIRMLMGLR